MGTLKVEGIFKPALMAAFKLKIKKNISAGVKKGLTDVFPVLREKIASDTAANFKIKQKGFAKAVKKVIYDRDKNKFPGMLIVSKAPWMNAHEMGKTVTGSKGFLIVPFLKTRITRKKFAQILEHLKQSKNLYFQKRGGKTIVFAKNLKDSDKYLSKFKSLERMNRGGVRSLKRGTMIPIGVLIKQSVLKKRFHLNQIVNANTGLITQTILKNIQMDK